MAKKKQQPKAQREQPQPPPAQPTADAATPHTAAGVTRGAIPVPGAKRGGFIPPASQFKGGGGGGRGGGPAPTGKTGGMNLRATSHTKGARGR